MKDRLLKLTEFSLVHGPIELPDRAISFDDNWKTEIYIPDEIANAILSIPNVELIHDATPEWDAWDARWLSGDHYIYFDIAEARWIRITTCVPASTRIGVDRNSRHIARCKRFSKCGTPF